jgi:hypothetical protein
MKKLFLLLIPVIVVACAAYPYLALYRLGEALRAQDLDAVEAKVDWPKLRQGIKDDVNAALVAKAKPEEGDPLAALGVALAGKLAGPIVDAAVTPAGLAAAAAADRPTLTTLATQLYVSTSADRSLPRLVQSGFSGLGSFEATVMPRGATARGDAIRLRFELESGYWMLVRVHLPMS